MIDQSLWRAHELPEFSGREFPNQIDVAIIGGGITGLTAAYLLKQAGKRVAVFERERIGAGETGNTSAHLTYVTDLKLVDIVKRFGQDGARHLWQGGAAAIDLIETNASERGIDCGFQRVPGYTCSAFLGTDDESDMLRDEAKLAVELGFDAAYVENGPITGKPAVAYADQAIFHPLDYIAGLALAINGDGSYVFEKAEVDEVLQDPLAITVNGQTIACGDVVIATHVPITGSTPLISSTLFQTKVYPYSSYVLGAGVADSIAPGLYSDTASPYYYLRVHNQDGRRYAIFGGEDHKTGQETNTDERYVELERAFKLIVPSGVVERTWSGQVIESPDGMPFIGKTAEHQYAATCYSGNGLTFGTLAGIMMHDFVMGVQNPWTSLFDPHRKPNAVGSVAEYISENVDYPFYFVADRLRQNKSDGPESVAPGDGKVLKIDGQRVAVHCTTEGEIKKVSAVCTHMGCLVRWNGAEKTWDCPCHGSRFTPDGLVLGGPAEAALEKVES